MGSELGNVGASLSEASQMCGHYTVRDDVTIRDFRADVVSELWLCDRRVGKGRAGIKAI